MSVAPIWQGPSRVGPCVFPVVQSLNPVELLATRLAYQHLGAVLAQVEAAAGDNAEERKRARSLASAVRKLLAALPEVPV